MSNLGDAMVGTPSREPGKDGQDTADAFYRSQVLEIYKKHNPAEVAHVDMLLQNYTGPLPALVDELRNKYEGGSTVASPSLHANRLSQSGAAAAFASSQQFLFGGGGSGAAIGSENTFGQFMSPFGSAPSPFAATSAFNNSPSPAGATIAAVPVTPSHFRVPAPAGALPMPPGDRSVLKAWLLYVFQSVNPGLVHQIDDIMKMYLNNEGVLIQEILSAYGQYVAQAPIGWAAGCSSASPVPTLTAATPSSSFAQGFGSTTALPYSGARPSTHDTPAPPYGFTFGTASVPSNHGSSLFGAIPPTPTGKSETFAPGHANFVHGLTPPTTRMHGVGTTMPTSSAFGAPQQSAGIPASPAPPSKPGTGSPAWRMTPTNAPADTSGVMVMSISAMTEYEGKSHEELRLEDYLENRTTSWARRGYRIIRHDVFQ